MSALGGLGLEILAPLGLLALAGLVLSVAWATRFGRQPPWAPRAVLGGPLDPHAAAALAQSDPLGFAVRLLLPALVQALLFGILLVVVVYFWRRRRLGAPPADREVSA